jgi:hypothetical protein
MPREFSKLCGSTLNESRRLLTRRLLFHNNAGSSSRRVVCCSAWVGPCRFRIRFALSIGQGDVSTSPRPPIVPNISNPEGRVKV